MRYIEIKDGLSIAIKDIEAIERIGEFETKLYCHFNTYDTAFPYATILAILEQEQAVPEVMQKLDAVLNNSQHFGG